LLPSCLGLASPVRAGLPLVILGASLALAQPAPAAALPAPCQSVSVMAWLGGWSALRGPEVAIPAADGQIAADLEKAFRVEWTRTGQALRLKVTKLEDAWVGRLAVLVRFQADTAALTYGYNDLPVRVPVAQAKQGQILWAWEYSVPGWLLGEQGTASAGLSYESTNSHGFFLDRAPDGTVLAHLSLDWPKKAGESVEAAFRIVDGETPAALRAERRKRLGAEQDPPLDAAQVARVKAAGFVRVDAAGTGFETADGKPLRVLGMNTAHLASLSPAEQEKVLVPAAAAGVNLTRFLIPDYAYRPLGEWNDEAVRRLLATVERCAAHGIRSIVCLEYSGCGGQYNESLHRSPNWSDLYLLPETLAAYRDTVARVVAPLRDNPAVFSYNVTNEPDLALTPPSPALLTAWRAWLAGRYGSAEALRARWGTPDLPGTDAAELPKQEDYDGQKTRQAEDFLAFGGEAVGSSMIRRAQAVRDVDARHLLTISAWNPRWLRGLPGAAVFDYWAPHSYEIYFIGPEISEQVAYQVGLLRRALPDRVRPVVIEECGLFEDPKFPEPMRAEHCGKLLEGGELRGAGMMFWYDLTPPLLAEFAKASRRTPTTLRMQGPELAYYVAPSAECRVSVYPLYMWRRWWGRALATAQDAGLRPREVLSPEEARGCQALLVLAAGLTAGEAQTARAMGLPVFLPEGAEAAKQELAEATTLPKDAAGQIEVWKRLLHE
jgi:hypothetical protein